MPIQAQGDFEGAARRVLALTEVRPGDAAALAELKRASIAQKTIAGLDANDQSFAPYSDRGPIYIDLGRGGKNGASRRASALRLVRKIRGKSGGKKSKVTAVGAVTKEGYLKAESYRWFKLNFLGRSGVDLMGPRAPHMLQSIVSRLLGQTSGGVKAELAFQNPEKEVIASGHMSGNAAAGKLPRRAFFEWGRTDGRELAQKWREMILGRLRQ